jgi:5-methylcytosine-specific restriction endonuclease McrA
LILNATFEPLSIVRARRAVMLVLRESADVVEPGDDVWHSETVAFEVPSVVRLRSYVKVPYRRRVPLTRNAVFARDGHRCQYCTGPAESLDHVIPKSRGGTHSWDNVVACCRRCNIRKGSKLLGESGFHLNRMPAAPSYHGWLYATLGTSPDPRWQRYLLADSA